jgi:hypothetical protein
VKSAGEALDPNRTGPAESLGPVEDLRLLREEQLGGAKAGKLTAIGFEVVNNCQQH